ncbi:DUF1800 domain-containing protein [Psychrosphaera sp. B3R10]|uniref:DUF1800 domain-containing protein n=1 Tax=unclassified Psychrosphaera TaxID=2641570 RepID=UPI001C0A4DD7|nr:MULTISPECIES: DUF1800 domain-containing protein [unclassified Psychrosphaera]MBU2881433.1 DUF1800 domain-containing protein [Psychrosphaera sp. I2R16]MBU2989555.1 DUF1800 domain-containing protein [Psychrosphaera sp. B3R10]
MTTKLKFIMPLSIILLLISCGDNSSKSNTEPVVKIIPEPESPINAANASRLLNQLTFGATLEDINYLVEINRKAWLEEQFDVTPSLHVPLIEPFSDREDFWRKYRMAAWFERAIYAPDQLRQRMAFVLSEIFVISEFNDVLGNDPKAVANYYDLLVTHAFGNYRDLLEAVTLSPAMGIYLSMLGNEKPDTSRNIRPDENYAREVMQLFTIGLVELENDGSIKLDENGAPISTYDQATIKGFAHVFTGWHYNGTTEDTWFRWWDNQDLYGTMVPVQAFHDTAEKALFSGVLLPANQTAEQDLKTALDALFNHPNVAPFIAKQLIQKFITSNPTPAYVERIANVFIDNGAGERGDLKAVVKALILDEEAINGHISAPDTFGKMREPILKATHLWRAFNLTTDNEIIDMGWPDYYFNQAPLASASVFNFYRPDYSPPSLKNATGLVAPELQIATETAVTHTSNFVAWLGMWHAFSGDFSEIEEDKRQQLWIDLTEYVPLAESDPRQIIEQLNLILTGDILTTDAIDLLVDYYGELEWAPTHERISNIIFLIMSSPQYSVIR